MDTTKYNHRHQSFYQTYQLPHFWTRYRFSLPLQNIGLHTSGQDISPFLQSFKMLNIITDYKMGPPLSALFMMEPLSLPNQREPCKAINMHSRWPTELQNTKDEKMLWYPHANKLLHYIEKCAGTPMLSNCSIILKNS